MVRSNLGSMSVDALLKPRDDVGKVLSQKADQLQDQLSRLGGEFGKARRGRGNSLKGRKVAIKFRDRSGNTWAGRGAQPCARSSKLVPNSKTLRSKRPRLPAKLPRGNRRSDARPNAERAFSS
jgi:hypothetical protein